MVELFCGNSRGAKAVGCFLQRSSIGMFDRILNATLSEKVSTTWVSLPLEVFLPPNSPDSPNTKTNR